MDIWLDEAGAGLLRSVWSDTASLALAVQTKSSHFGFTDKPVWVRFALSNTTETQLGDQYSVIPLLDDIQIEIRQRR